MGAVTRPQSRDLFAKTDSINADAQVTIPCVTILHTDAEGKIDDYRVYFDVAPIYA